MDLQCFTIVALATTDLTWDINIWQEVHFNLDDTFTFTGFAASTLNIEGETSRLITTQARFRHLGKEFADACECVGIGRRIRTWRASKRRLVNIDHFIKMFQPLNCIMCARSLMCAEEDVRQFTIQNVGDQRTL